MCGGWETRREGKQLGATAKGKKEAKSEVHGKFAAPLVQEVGGRGKGKMGRALLSWGWEGLGARCGLEKRVFTALSSVPGLRKSLINVCWDECMDEISISFSCTSGLMSTLCPCPPHRQETPG